jgi:hypothetical protein
MRHAGETFFFEVTTPVFAGLQTKYMVDLMLPWRQMRSARRAKSASRVESELPETSVPDSVLDNAGKDK